ncbi:MAG: hypothetical protein HY725_13835 [Candidatus Rokubacteria bacterium]|nr:hypothetical protein [Candidatus Rokubacteria bacterium]
MRPYGTVVTRIPGRVGRPPLLVSEVDRHGTLLTSAEWDEDGALRHAKVRTPDGGWIGIEPGAGQSPIWGRSDRLVQLNPERPFRPVEPITLFQSLDYAAIKFIPPLAEPERLPPGAGTAVLNFLACLLADQGTPRVRYRGPYATELLFTALLESFRYDPAAASPLEQFTGSNEAMLAGDLAESPLDWSPAPHERRFARAGVYVQLRDGVEKVVFEGRAYYRQRWQGVVRDEPRVVREDGDGIVCSLWALGEAIEDHLILDRSGNVLAVLPMTPVEGKRTALSPGWRRTLGELIAHGSAPLLRPSILGVVERLPLEWGPVTGDLVEVGEDRLVVSLRLPHLFRRLLEAQHTLGQRVGVALRFAAEVAKLLGPAVRRHAQTALASLPESGQQAALELAAATSHTAASTLQSFLDRLVHALISGRDLPD